jgi:hypothetical protein
VFTRDFKPEVEKRKMFLEKDKIEAGYLVKVGAKEETNV